MTRVLRTLGVLVLMGGALAVAGPAAAAPAPAVLPAVVDECDENSASYVPGQVCDLEVEVVPYCENDIPYLGYRVETAAEGDLELTWVNPGGSSVVVGGLPREGSVMWPGVVLGPDGAPVDWPGWTPSGDGWVEGDEYSWTLPSVDVVLSLGADALVTVAYPDLNTPECSTTPGTPPGGGELPGGGTPGGTPGGGEGTVNTGGSAGGNAQAGGSAPQAAGPGALSSTGAEIGTAVGIAAGLLLLGGAAVAVARRRHATH